MSRARVFLLSWIPYFAFVALALAHGWHDAIFTLDRPHATLKVAVWLTWLAFLAYSMVATTRASLFRTIREMLASWWGRQICADLYIGLALFLALIGLHEGSALVVLAWLLPVLAFANLATLVYLALHFDAIIARFT